MKKLLLMGMLLSLTACFETKQEAPPPSPPASIEPPVSTVKTNHNTTRHNFTTACVQSAMGTKQNPDMQKLAEQICDCVYDEGVKMYNDEREWEKAIERFEKSTPDPKLDKLVKTAIPTCASKHTPNQATASAPKQ